MAKKTDVRKFACDECKNINYYRRRRPSKKGVEQERIETQKFCPNCRTHTVHKEQKK